MRNMVSLVCFTLCFAICTVGCSGEKTPQERPVTPVSETEATQAPGTDRPQTKEVAIFVEGIEEKVATKLYQTPDGFPLPFITYIPEDYTAKTLLSKDGSSIIFSKGKAFLSITVSSNPVSQDIVVANAKKVVASQGAWVEKRSTKYASFYLIDARDASLSTEVDEQAGRFFYWTRKYPFEMADGFIPRADMIIDHIEWQ